MHLLTRKMKREKFPDIHLSLNDFKLVEKLNTVAALLIFYDYTKLTARVAEKFTVQTRN